MEGEDSYDDEDPFTPDIDLILADKQVEEVSSASNLQECKL
jgi:hypothetical protein